jgi:uncharacterized membrane protein
MTEEMGIGAVPSGEINDQDKLWSALSYIFAPLVGIIVLLMEENKKRPFQKYHAVQSIALVIVLVVVVVVLEVVVWIATAVLAAVTMGIGSLLSFCSCCPIVVWVLPFYYAYQAYQGVWIEIPYLTEFLKGQKWV